MLCLTNGTPRLVAFWLQQVDLWLQPLERFITLQAQPLPCLYGILFSVDLFYFRILYCMIYLCMCIYICIYTYIMHIICVYIYTCYIIINIINHYVVWFHRQVSNPKMMFLAVPNKQQKTSTNWKTIEKRERYSQPPTTNQQKKQELKRWLFTNVGTPTSHITF